MPVSKRTTTIAVLGTAGAAVGVGLITVAGDASVQDTAGGVVSTSRAAASTVDVVPSNRARLARGRNPVVSRAGARPVLASLQRATKSSAMPVSKQDVSRAVTETVQRTDPRDIAMGMLADYGWGNDQFPCLDAIYMHESGWNPSAANPSGAFGIPQALPGDKMAAYGSDWQTNPTTQLKWGLAYIHDRYGSPCGAWGFWQLNSWY